MMVEQQLLQPRVLSHDLMAMQSKRMLLSTMEILVDEHMMDNET